jgi:hypothetical protein
MFGPFQYKCGYCGWLFRFNTNFLEHECFKHYVEDEDQIYVDENYVVTICMFFFYSFILYTYFLMYYNNIYFILNILYIIIIYLIDGTKTAENSSKDNLDELLIGAVNKRRALYDYSTPAYGLTNLRKNALWTEVSNTLGGTI